RLFFLNKPIAKVNKFECKNMYFYSMLFNLVGLIGLYFHIAQFGFSISILELAKMASDSRYNGEGVSPFQILGSSFLFANSFIFGFFSAENQKEKVSLLVCLILVILTAVLTASKASFLMSLTFFISGYLVRNLILDSRIGISGKVFILKKIAITIILVFLVAIFLQVVRYGGDSTMIEMAFNKILIYAFGQFSAYSVWFDNNYLNIVDTIPGYGVFTGVVSKIFDFDRVSGFYDSFTYISNEDYTNVFTLSRFLITDFTIYGACAFLFFLGVLYEVITRLKGVFGLKIFFLLSFSVEIIFGFSTSILSYNNVILANFLVGCYFSFNVKCIGLNNESDNY
ncbi:oligosaccharide repeat unit polymerase, partial [Vibrio parahaemolyticus]|nr:oligosaccharide repeat unit polymerase [Vibrio parahaemolyticus]